MRITDDMYLQPSEIGLLLKAAEPNPRDYLMIALQYDLGCRSGELRQLRVKDVSFERGIVFIGLNQEESEQMGKKMRKARAKKGRRESVFGIMVPHIGALLRSHIERFKLQPDDLLFFDTVHGGARNAPLSNVLYNRMINGYAVKAGIQKTLPNGRKKVTSHRLRHSFTMHALRRPGVTTTDVCSQIGDKIGSIDPYVNPTPEDIRSKFERANRLEKMEE